MICKARRLILLTMLAAIAPAVAIACSIENTPQSTAVPSDLYDIAVTTLPENIRVGDLFAVHIDICQKDGSSFNGNVSARATMPAHKHGMNYEPEVVSAENGRFVLEGFSFHMQGRWQFEFDLAENGETTTVLLDYVLK
jgi:hypothetical protein